MYESEAGNTTICAQGFLKFTLISSTEEFVIIFVTLVHANWTVVKYSILTVCLATERKSQSLFQ